MDLVLEIKEKWIHYMQVEAEVSRLEELKASKMKELVLKKRSELEEICRKTHMIPEADSALDYVIEAMESGIMFVPYRTLILLVSLWFIVFLCFIPAVEGAVDASCVLEQIELQVAKVKEEAFSRKEILEKVDKWLAACEEESWLEEYNRVGCFLIFELVFCFIICKFLTNYFMVI